MGTHAAKKSVGLHNQASTRAEHHSGKKNQWRAIRHSEE